MDREILNLHDARIILAKAYMDTIGLEPAHSKVWRAIEDIDRQIRPLVEAAMCDEAVSNA